MSGRYISIVALSALLMTPAVAQTPPGTFDRGTQFVAQNVRSQEMGGCAVRHDRRRAIAIAITPAGMDDGRTIKEFMPALMKCLDGARSATLDPSYIRGGIAEALLAEREGALLVDAAKLTPATPARVVLAGAKEPNVTLLACAAAARPADAAAMLSSPPASVAEADAFRRLVPALQACAPAEGEIHLDPARIRPATAIALYRLVALR